MTGDVGAHLPTDCRWQRSLFVSSRSRCCKRLLFTLTADPPGSAGQQPHVIHGGFFGSYSLTDTSALRFSLTLARAIVSARSFEAEAALIVVRDLDRHAPPYLSPMSQSAEEAILAVRGQSDGRLATIAREALDRLVTEMECHILAEQPASRN